MGWPIPNPENYTCTDVYGNGFNVEKTAAVGSVRAAGDYGETDFIYTGNGYFNEEMVPEEGEGLVEFVEHAGYGTRRIEKAVTSDGTIMRNLMTWDMLYNYQGYVDLEFAKMMWRFPGPSDPDWGTTVIGRSSNEHIVIGLPDDGDDGVAWICTGPAARQMYPSGWSPAIDSTHTFFRVTLPATPSEVVSDARSQARTDSRNAYRKVMLVAYDEPGYQVLNSLYSLGMEEFYEGEYFKNSSITVSGNDKLLLLSKATTAYARAQSHFRQILNLLDPPATTPEDLGLEPWGFWE